MAEYKIKDLEVLTGIKAHTIRMWEKRYGILKPERTETQIRQYSDSELSFLLNVALLNKSGVKISYIAQMPPNEITRRVIDLQGTNDTSIDRLILALVEMDECLFEQTLNELVDAHGLMSVYTDYLVPFLERIGVMWMVGSINPAQEHFISVLVRQMIIVEISKTKKPLHNSECVLLFLPEHEQHEISLLFYQYFLRSNGINTVYLGQSVPYDALLDSIKRTKPKALITSWLTGVDPNFVQTYFKNLKKDTNLPIYSGGAQIHNNSMDLRQFVHEIKNYKDLEKHFLKRS